MDHHASLIEASGNLRRRLYVASMTWTARLDNLFSSLLMASDEGDGFDKEAKANIGIGKGFAAMFLLAGVRGLPPIKGQDAIEWVTAWKAANPGAWHSQVVKLDKALPSTYGSEIAGPLWAAAVATSAGNQSNADDLLQDTYIKFLGGDGQKIDAHDLAGAIKYVKTMIAWRGKNTQKRLRRDQSLTVEDDEGQEIEREVGHDRDLDKLMSEHNAKLIFQKIQHDHALRGKLEAVHPDALQYLDLNAQGYDDTEILGIPAMGGPNDATGPSMLKHPNSSRGIRLYPRAWNGYKAKMFAIIKDHFQHQPHAMAASDYDRRQQTTA